MVIKKFQFGLELERSPGLLELLPCVWLEMNVWKLTYKKAPVLNNIMKAVEDSLSVNLNTFAKKNVNQAPIGAEIANKNKWNRIIPFLSFWFNKIEVKENAAGNLWINIASIMRNPFESSGFASSDNIDVVKMIPSVKQCKSKPNVVEFEITEKR